jgi:mercuric ion transport protein
MSEMVQDKNVPVTGAKPAVSVLSGLGLIAAIAALVGASCCALPLLLAWAGLAGAWIANLGVFVAYRPYITGAALVMIALGWVSALWRGSPRRTLVVLACATVLVLAAIALTQYEPQVTRYLVSFRRK